MRYSERACKHATRVLLDANGNQDYKIPNDFYTTIYDAIDFAGESNGVKLHSPELIYLFEFHRISEIGGTTSISRCPGSTFCKP